MTSPRGCVSTHSHLRFFPTSIIPLLISKNGPVPAGYFVIKKFKVIGTLPNVLGYQTQQKKKHYWNCSCMSLLWSRVLRLLYRLERLFSLRQMTGFQQNIGTTERLLGKNPELASSSLSTTNYPCPQSNFLHSLGLDFLVSSASPSFPTSM